MKLPKYIENSALILISLFLCFGYMTGSDWYNYEQYYSNPHFSKELDRIEIGYLYLQGFFGKLGLNFWIFHITLKVLVFYLIVSFTRWLNINTFLFLAFFIPEIGFYLFIDCPFRNLIAFGISLVALKALFENKKLKFVIYAFIAITFHLSSFFLIIIYFICKKNIKTSIIIITALLVYIIAFNVDSLISNIYIPLTKISPLISEKLKGYFLNSHYISDKFSIGTFVRLIILLFMLLYKKTIISEDNTRKYIYNLSVLFLLIYPFGVTMKIFYRLSLFLVPFYIVSIIYLLTSFKIKTNKYLLYLFVVLLYFKQTYSLITYDSKYIPYTNYISYLIKNDFPNIEYRHQYNFKHSPYKGKKTSK